MLVDRTSYLLGIFDGEGSITAIRRGTSRGWALHVSVTISDRRIVEMFLKEWGGGLYSVKPSAPGRMSLWRWATSGSKALPFLRVAKEGLIVKRRQAELATVLAEQMAYYRKRSTGVAVSRGELYISEEDMAERNRIALELRSLNGARSRFAERYAS